MLHVLFDLDGTLTDPKEGIFNGIRHVLNRFNCDIPSETVLSECIGPPLRDSFSQLLNSRNEHLVPEAMSLYREHYSAIGMFENRVYTGIENLLKALKRRGNVLYVATSKPEVFASAILRHFHLERYFSAVYGSNLDGSRADKADLIAHILNEEHLFTGDTVMIGDRKYDMIGAAENGLKGIGVLWGYGSRTELEQSGAAAVCDTPEHLQCLLMTD